MLDYTKKPFCLDSRALAWVEDTFASMTEEEKLNQVFVHMLWDLPPEQVAEDQGHLQLGGYRYNNMGAEAVYAQNAAIQSASKIPALIAANVEAGGNGAVSGGTKIGEGIACAATGDPEAAYQMGLCGCREAAAVGCNWTFAPVTDIDVNWRNCVIPTRCFGNDPDTVLQMSLAYMRGAHEAGVACCMKHFPGDGCDERDQHLVTTYNDRTVEEWDASYGKVLKGMIDAGIPSIMVGHIALPAYSKALRPGIRDEDILPATVAPELLGDLLRGKLGFNGLVITDATHMVGITGRLPRREFIPKMIEAGCDMILYYRNHGEDLNYIREALRDGRLSRARFDDAVKNILAFKASLKLHEKQKNNTLMPPKEGLSVIGCEEHRRIASDVIDRSITLVKNTRGQLPLDPEKQKRIIIYTAQGIDQTLKAKLLPGKGKAPSISDIFAEELREQGFEPTIYTINIGDYIGPNGINGKKALADTSVGEFAASYDAAIVLCNVSSFSVTNERMLHWTIPMGPEIPWYATEIPTVAISLANPFHLIDLAMVPTYINTYNASREAIHQTVLKLVGKSAFHGVSPVDAFCGRMDTRL